MPIGNGFAWIAKQVAMLARTKIRAKCSENVGQLVEMHGNDIKLPGRISLGFPIEILGIVSLYGRPWP